MHTKVNSKPTKPEIDRAQPRDARSLGNIRAIGSGASSSGVRILQSSPITSFLEARRAKFEGSRSGKPIHAKNTSATPSFGPGNIGDDYLKSPSFGVNVPQANFAGVPIRGSSAHRNSEAEIGLPTTRCSMPVISRKSVDIARKAFTTAAGADRVKHTELNYIPAGEEMPKPILTVDKPVRRRRKLSKKQKPKKSLA